MSIIDEFKKLEKIKEESGEELNSSLLRKIANSVEKIESENIRLNDLLERIYRDNIHKEIKTGKPVGKEIW